MKMKNVLIQKYSFDPSIAHSVVSNFLTQFRLCPHNTKVSLDEWRLGLWSQAMPDTCSHLAGDIYETWLQYRYECMKPSKSVLSLLKRLREHYTLVLITNGTSEHQWEKIRMLKMRKYFDCVLVSGDLPWEKPNPCIFYKACQSVSVKPCECIMIGDKIETDILGGIQANLGGTILLSSNGKKMATSRPHHVIQDILDLGALIPSPSQAHSKVNASLMDLDESSCSSNASR
ncbi:hypothetical protein M8J77_009975 [Diaphorina citri]|nr:hypothetical protein M8J77_009975 [Diaphorina citri]